MKSNISITITKCSNLVCGYIWYGRFNVESSKYDFDVRAACVYIYKNIYDDVSLSFVASIRNDWPWCKFCGYPHHPHVEWHIDQENRNQQYNNSNDLRIGQYRRQKKRNIMMIIYIWEQCRRRVDGVKITIDASDKMSNGMKQKQWWRQNRKKSIWSKIMHMIIKAATITIHGHIYAYMYMSSTNSSRKLRIVFERQQQYYFVAFSFLIESVSGCFTLAIITVLTLYHDVCY